MPGVSPAREGRAPIPDGSVQVTNTTTEISGYLVYGGALGRNRSVPRLWFGRADDEVRASFLIGRALELRSYAFPAPALNLSNASKWTRG